jgi:hypothetical protein
LALIALHEHLVISASTISDFRITIEINQELLALGPRKCHWRNLSEKPLFSLPTAFTSVTIHSISLTDLTAPRKCFGLYGMLKSIDCMESSEKLRSFLMNHILIDIQLEAVCPNLWAIQESKAMIAPKLTGTFRSQRVLM